MPQCQAINCSNRQHRGGKSFFQIPDPRKSKFHRALCKKWLDLLRNDKLCISNFVGNKSRVVCEDHFLPDCFEGVFSNSVAASLNFKHKRKQLKPDALPTIVHVNTDTSQAHSRRSSDQIKKRREAQVIINSFKFYQVAK